MKMSLWLKMHSLKVFFYPFMHTNVFKLIYNQKERLKILFGSLTFGSVCLEKDTMHVHILISNRRRERKVNSEKGLKHK